MNESLDIDRSIADNLPDLIMRFDQDCRFLYVNPVISHFWSGTAADCLGKRHHELGFPADKCAFWEERIRRVFATGTPHREEFSFQDIIFDWRLIPETNGSDQVLSVLSIARDLTAQRLSERNHRMLFERMLDGFALHELICDEAGRPIDYRYLAINPAFEALTGCEASELIGRTVREVMPATEQHWIDTFGAVALSGKSVHYENYAQEIGRWFRVVAFQTAPLQFAVLCTDTTEVHRAHQALQRSETRFRDLAEASPNPMFEADSQGRVTYVNERFCTLVALDASSALGQGWAERIHPDDQERVFASWSEAVSSGSDFELELRVLRPDQQVLTFLVRARPLRDAQERVSGWVGSGVDITDLRELEERQRRSQRLESLGDLASGIAHDFNNLLQAINGFSELLLNRTPEGDPNRPLLGHISSAGERAQDLVDRILAVTRRQDRQIEAVDLVRIIDEALGLLRPAMPSGIRVQRDLAIDSAVVRADPGELHQVLMNLGTNARHAMEISGGTLTIRLAQVTTPLGIAIDAAQCYRLSVSDEGCGMDAATRERVFEPYFTTKAADKGTGLGLAMVHNAIVACGGAIDIDSAPGCGTTFEIWLPIHHDTESHRKHVHNSAPTWHIQRGQVLLVDDEALLRNLTQAHLEEMGCTVCCCDSAEEAWTSFCDTAHDFRLVITDYCMPGAHGIELAQRIHDQRPDLPIILCTGYALETDPVAKIQAGIVAQLDKPFRRENLIALIERFLD